MHRLKREGKRGQIRLTPGLSLGVSKELLLSLGGVIFLHILFFSIIKTKEEMISGQPLRRSIALTFSIDEEPPPSLKENFLNAAAIALLTEATSARPAPIGRFEPGSSILHFKESDFSVMQEWLHALVQEPLFKAASQFYPEMEYRLLGPLATHSFPASEIKAWDEPFLRYQCLYEICIEGRSGDVIFSRLVKGEAPLEILKKAESALSSLHFPSSNQPMIKGFIEIIVTRVRE